MRDWPDALRRERRKLLGQILRMRDELARIEREAAERAVAEQEHALHSEQLTLFEQPRHPRANRRRAA